MERHSAFVTATKLIVSAILIPGLLWLVATWYANKEKERDAARVKYAEIVAALPRISSAEALLYEPCVGTDFNSCATSVRSLLAEYLKAEREFSEVAVRYYPDLKPTTVLLLSINVEYDVSSLWQGYFACVKRTKDDLECAREQRRNPIKNLVISKFLAEFLECRVKSSLAKELGTGSTDYCEAVIKARQDVALDLPTQAMRGYNGLHLPGSEIVKIRELIWQRYIVPGSGIQ